MRSHLGQECQLQQFLEKLKSWMPLDPGTIGGTYIGNPVSCAAALATIQLMKDENLNARAMEVGEMITSRFKNLQRNFHKLEMLEDLAL